MQANKKPEKVTKKTRIFNRHSTNKTITIYVANSREPKKVKLGNIGMGGLSFKLNKRLRVGDSLFVQSTIPGQPERIKAQVTWVKDVKGVYNIGVVFPDQHYTSRAAILGSMLTK